MATKKTAGARKATLPDIEVLDAPPSEDQQLVSTDTAKLTSFMGGLAAFFRGAAALEKKAKEKLDIAQQLKPPANADEDAKVQLAIRDAKLTRKEIDDHWGITAVVHGLHRKLTAARERAGANADKANDIAQALHNRYVEDEKRRVRQEEDRLRREAEARAQAERDAEQARLEAEAVKAEEKSPELSARESDFVAYMTVAVYNTVGNPTMSAANAGFKNPGQAAARLMNSPKIQAALAAKQQAEAIRTQAKAQAERPLDTAPIEAVTPNITRATPGGYDRSTNSAEVFDVDAFMAALLDPRTRTALGIPADIATFQQTKMNEHARNLGKLIEKWPGVRLKTKTTTV